LQTVVREDEEFVFGLRGRSGGVGDDGLDQY